MLYKFLVALALVSSTPALSKTLLARPIEADGQTIRYDRGYATAEDDMTDAAVSISSGKVLNHGSLQFRVAVYNKGTKPVNFGVENILVTHRDISSVCFTVEQLVKAERNRAMWSQIAYATLAATAAAVQNNKTTVTTVTPRGGIYRTVINRPGLGDGQIVAAAGGAAAIVVSQVELQKTVANLDTEILQTTTIDPQSGYGGRVVAQKLKKAQAGDIVTVTVTLGAELHSFKFKLVEG